LVRLLVTNDGEPCDEADRERAPDENAHYVYLDTTGKIILEQPWREGDTDATP